MRYTVNPNYCDCHPETCCCDPYRLVDNEEKEVVTTFYNKDKANKVAAKLNKLTEDSLLLQKLQNQAQK